MTDEKKAKYVDVTGELESLSGEDKEKMEQMMEADDNESDEVVEMVLDMLADRTLNVFMTVAMKLFGTALKIGERKGTSPALMAIGINEFLRHADIQFVMTTGGDGAKNHANALMDEEKKINDKKMIIEPKLIM